MTNSKHIIAPQFLVWNSTAKSNPFFFFKQCKTTKSNAAVFGLDKQPLAFRGTAKQIFECKYSSLFSVSDEETAKETVSCYLEYQAWVKKNGAISERAGECHNSMYWQITLNRSREKHGQCR